MLRVCGISFPFVLRVALLGGASVSAWQFANETYNFINVIVRLCFVRLLCETFSNFTHSPNLHFKETSSLNVIKRLLSVYFYKRDSLHLHSILWNFLY